MFLLNLSLAELLAIFGAISAAVLALYLLDRSRQRQTVASLRFWISAGQSDERRSRRRRIQQPLSLVLQLVSIACLLLAVAQLRLGTREGAGRDHVLIVDTSAWMDAMTANGPLIEEARKLALEWLRRLPPADRVMVIRADALATPATVFESNRKPVEEAIALSAPGGTALDIGKAIELGRHVQQLHSARAGEIVFVGAGRVAGDEAGLMSDVPPNLRVIPVEAEVDNCGLRRIGLRRSISDPAVWEIFVSVRNDGRRARNADLALQFGGSPVGLRRLSLPPGAGQNVTFTLHTRAAGWLEARLLTTDGFPADDRALIELPAQRIVKVAVYSGQPEWIRPVLAANPHVEARFHKPSEYSGAAEADIVILDGFNAAKPPDADVIWIEPPEGSSPVPVRARTANPALMRWHPEHPLASGLRTGSLRIASAAVFAASPGDVPVAEVEEGPVILARPGKHRIVVMGFHPMRPATRYELATPLLFANILRWMAPDIFRRWELNAGSVGSVKADLDADADLSQVSVLAADQTPLPFTIEERSVRFFAGTQGTVRVVAGNREMVYSLTLPEAASETWEPPRSVRRGMPAASGAGISSRDLWQMLALAGLAGLLADWMLFGRFRPGVRRTGRRWLGLVPKPSRKAS